MWAPQIARIMTSIVTSLPILAQGLCIVLYPRGISQLRLSNAEERQIALPQVQHLDPLPPSQEPVFHGFHMLDVAIHRLRSKDKWVSICWLHSPGLTWKETKTLMYRLLITGAYSKTLNLFSTVRHTPSSEIMSTPLTLFISLEPVL